MSDSLTFRLLTYIKAVAETLNFTRAAQRLYLAQPSLSQQIRDLEDQLKVPLFERGGHQIRVTDAGRLLVAYADTALRERDEIVAMARAIYLGQVPPLRLGFSSFINAALLQSFREHYEEMFPGCEIHLSGGDPVLILQRLNQRIIDCAILPMPIDEDLYSVQQIAESPLVICMPSNDPLANHAHDCLTAVGQYRAGRTQNVTASSSLNSFQFDNTDATNTEVQQLNLLNAAQGQGMAEMQSQGALQVCMAGQMTVANMERRDAAVEDMNTAAFVQQQRAANDASAASESNTWQTYLP
jgi:DNA-binding transcriptional LysR family regulator